MEQIEALKNCFGSYLSQKPFVFQKFSVSGLMLVREIISRAHEEISEFCYEDLAKELNKKDQQIEEYSKLFQKENEQKEDMLDEKLQEESNAG